MDRPRAVGAGPEREPEDRRRLGCAAVVAAAPPGGPRLPHGLGWFVQTFRGEPIVWQFGVEPDAYSALYVKVPNRQLTFILFANSDALVAPYGLEAGDVTASLYARLFLLLFVP